MKNNNHRFVLLLVVIVFMFCGCSSYVAPGNNGYNPGETLTKEELDRLLEQQSTTKGVSVDDITVYYWTESGGKLHLYSDCGALKNSSFVNHGSYNEAIHSGKDEPCAVCLKRMGISFDEFIQSVSENDTYTTHVQETSTADIDNNVTQEKSSLDITLDTICWRTKEGKKFHLFRDCQYIAKKADSEIIEEQVEAVFEVKGLTGPCTSCLKRAGESETMTMQEFADVVKKIS